MAETNEFYIKIGADVKDAQDKLNSLSAELSKLGTVTQTTSTKIGSSMGGASRAISSAFAAIGVSLSIASIIGVGKSALKTAADLEQTAVAFKVFTGSAETANAMLSELKAQALKSPMQFQDITKGAQTLLQYGLTAKQTTEITRMLGDISGGNADKFQRLSLAFGQVTAAGRLMGQEARQMINAGFNPLQAISDKTGQSMAVLTQKMHDGQISVKDVADAFIFATSEGGRFFGMADEQSKTLAGAYNKMSESISFTLAEIGNNLNEAFDLSTAATHVSDLVAKIGENFQSSGEKSTFWGNALKDVLSALALGLDIVIKSVKLFASAIEDLVNISGLNTFSKWLDDSTIKVAGLFGAEAQKNVRDFIGYLHSFDAGIVGVSNSMPSNIGQALPLMEKQAKELSKKMELQITIDPIGYKNTLEKFDKLNQQIDLLKKGSGRGGAVNLGFSSTPSRGTGDGQAKADKKLYEKLVQQAKSGFTEIHKQMRTGYETKLDIFDRYAKEELDKFKKFNIDTTKVEAAQYKMRQQIAKVELGKLSEIVNKNSSLTGLKNSLSKLAEHQANKYASVMALIKPLPGMEGGMLGQVLSDEQLIKFSASTQTALDNAQYFADKIKNAFLDSGRSIRAAVEEMTQSVASSFADMFSVIGQGGNAEDAIRSFASGMLSSLGDMFIKIGIGIVMASKAMIAVQAFLTSMFTPAGAAAGLLGGLAMMAIGGLLKGAGSALSKPKDMGTSSGGTQSVAQRSSGNNYTYGGSSYSAQTIRLAIDLTGAITATQTGYQINKSLETTLRVTGRQ